MLDGLMDGVLPVERYRARLWSAGDVSPAIRDAWGHLASRRDGADSLYNSPEFFDHLLEVENPARLHVVTIEDAAAEDAAGGHAGDAILGVVPLLRSTFRLSFSIRGRTLLAIPLSSLVLLGSEPMVPPDPAALDAIFRLIGEKFHRVRVIDLHAVPRHSFAWRYLASSAVVGQRRRVHVLHGFRDCHTIALPPSVDAYLGQLTRKRRYNLLRQERLLREHLGGTLELSVIHREQDLAELAQAITALGLSGRDNPLLDRRRYGPMARHGFLHCFVLKQGSEVIGLALGTRSKQIYRLDRIFYRKSLQAYSPGTTLWQIVLRTLVEDPSFGQVEMGYGTPSYRHSATNRVEQRGKVLLFRRSPVSALLILLHDRYLAAVAAIDERLGRQRPLPARRFRFLRERR